MALQLEFTTPHGITVPTAYAKIDSFSGNKGTIVVQVAYFATEAARLAGNPVLQHQAFQFNSVVFADVTDTDSLVAALYELLKTLPEFENATDV